MFKLIDNFLNKITMYRLMLWYLVCLWLAAFVFSSLGMLSFAPLLLVLSGAVILAVCWLTNQIMAWAYDSPTNVESVYITAFILILIISPAASLSVSSFVFMAVASLAAIASKFILAIYKKHVFNPAALGVAAAALPGVSAASWWLGTGVMLPFVAVGGFLIVRKIQRWDLALSFILAALASISVSAWLRGFDPVAAFERSLLHSPIFFFAFVMITEPLTTPPTRALRILYGLFVGSIFAPGVHLGDNFSTPELALLTGNVLSYLISPKTKLILTLKEKNMITPDLYDLVFTSEQKLKFRPGQYLEWTLAHVPSDQRGNRRYFTIASSPTEADIRMGVKFYPKASTYKQKLFSMNIGDKIVASQLAGDFTFPQDPSKKYVFIAGGIGITPFRSMAKYMTDTGEKRDAVLLYSAKAIEELAYTDVFEKAKSQGLKPAYFVGVITPEMIQQEVPDFKDRIFYISGPRSMVTAFQDALKKLGIPRTRIKTDFFPGLV